MMVYLTITLDPYKGSMQREDILVLLLTELTIFISSFTVVFKTYNANVILVSVCNHRHVVLSSYPLESVVP